MDYISKSYELINHLIIAVIISIIISLFLSLPFLYVVGLFILSKSSYGSWLFMLSIIGVYPFCVLYLAFILKAKDFFNNWIKGD